MGHSCYNLSFFSRKKNVITKLTFKIEKKKFKKNYYNFLSNNINLHYYIINYDNFV